MRQSAPAPDLPVAWRVETAGSHESNYVASLVDSARSRGFAAEMTALDMGYAVERVYGECEDRDSRPIIPLRETIGVKRGDIPRPCASMASGGSLAPPCGVGARSGGAPPPSAIPPRGG
jgi:hypothetical protein